MLQMTNVSKTYRTDTVETHALREFSLTVDEGYTVPSVTPVPTSSTRRTSASPSRANLLAE